jgi:PAS domain S-box-containing protein
MSSLDGFIVYANPALCRMFGADSLEDVVGKPVTTYVAEEYATFRENVIIPTLLKEGYIHSEQTIYPRRGPPFQTMQGIFLIRDERGTPLHLAVVVTDISERKRSEAKLKQANAELQAIYDGMVDGLHILDLDTTRAVRINAALCRMMGYTAEEAVKLSPADVHPAADLPWIEDSLRTHLAGGDASWTEDLPLVRKDGSVFYAEVTGIRGVYDGRPSLMCFFRDITERRRSHEALKREHRTLKHLLQSSDHERQLIAYEIHDGLAQQLAGAMMQFQTFQHLKDAQPVLATKAFDAGMTMLQQSHFETRRLIAGVRPPILDESGVVAAVGHLVNEQCRIFGMPIEFRSSVAFDRLAPTLENAIYRIAQEALTNACRHSRSERVRVALRQRGDRVRIDIRDWGVGFDPTRLTDGCYGLAGIRQRARLLDGKCRIHSTAETGTRITVELPLVLREA